MTQSLFPTSRRGLLLGSAAAAGLSVAPAFVRAQGSRRALKVSIGRIPWAAGNSPMSQYMINNKLMEKRAAEFGYDLTIDWREYPTALPMVAQLTGPFTAKHPNVRVSILSRTSAEILTGIESLDLDAGITYLDNEPLGRVAQVPLYAEFYRLLCAPGSALADRDQVTWAEVAEQPLCLLTGDMQNRRIMNQHLAEAGAAVVPQIESNSTIALTSHVLTGRWSSIVPRQLAQMFTSGGQLRAIPIVAPEVEHTVGLIAARRDPLTPVLAALIQEAERFGKQAGVS